MSDMKIFTGYNK